MLGWGCFSVSGTGERGRGGPHTDCDGVHALRLLQEAVHQLHLVQRRLLPPPFFPHRAADLGAQRLDVLRVRADVKDGVREQHGRRMHRRARQRQLINSKIILLPLRHIVKPPDAISRPRHLPILRIPPPLLPPLRDHRLDDPARLRRAPPQDAARGLEDVDERPQERRPGAQPEAGGDDVVRPHAGDLEPVVPSAQFGPDEDEGGEAGDDVEAVGVQVAGMPFWMLVVSSRPVARRQEGGGLCLWILPGDRKARGQLLGIARL